VLPGGLGGAPGGRRVAADSSRTTAKCSCILPQAGRVHKLVLPSQAGVRVDSGVAEGDAVSSFYDPLLAKLIVHAANRPAAMQLMRTALSSTAFLGLTTNIEFLQHLVARDEVNAGQYDTRFVERELAAWSGDEKLPVEVLVAAVLTELSMPGATDAAVMEDGAGDSYSPWGAGNGFRIGGK